MHFTVDMEMFFLICVPTSWFFVTKIENGNGFGFTYLLDKITPFLCFFFLVGVGVLAFLQQNKAMFHALVSHLLPPDMVFIILLVCFQYISDYCLLKLFQLTWNLMT